MAIDSIGAEALALLPRAEGGRFLMLGRQHLTLTAPEWRRIAARTGRSSKSIGDPVEGETFAEPFLRWLGYSGIESLDFSAYEGCSLVHDLNQPIPDDWEGLYDVVFDGGTLEHVFHYPNAITNAMRLVREGGYLVTCNPSNNYNGHGFFQFSAELPFRIFTPDNGFGLKLLALAGSTGPRAIHRVQDPQTLGHRVTFGGQGPTQIVVIARRLKCVSPFRTYPSQSDYASTWSAVGEPVDPVSPGRDGKKSGLAGSIASVLLPKELHQRIRSSLAEKARSRRAKRGVVRVGSLADCWLESGQPE